MKLSKIFLAIALLNSTALILLAKTTVFAQTLGDENQRIEQLSSPDALKRAEAAYSFGKKQKPSQIAIPQLIKLLGDGTSIDPSSYRKNVLSEKFAQEIEYSPGKEAAVALAEMGQSAVEPLLAVLNSNEWRVRMNAVWALGVIGDERAVDYLRTSLKDANAEVREQSAWALGMLAKEPAIDDLILALRDINPSVREQSAWALGMIGDSRAVGALKTALNDENKSVREQITESLKILVKE